MIERITQTSLPTRDQLCALRDFVHGRSYSAGSVAIRLPGQPPHAADSGVADAARASGALYDVTNVLCKRLLAELDAGQPGAAAELAWEALLAIAGAWRDAPNVPAELPKLVAGTDLRNA
ncbi:hypothetical protein [Kitasatospora mediocidica]|uniref:hypothetical protein n=1 Tax=Kitasatospora mediocidica TaxID=58352 RepID=UPI0012FBC190|nr:hypothetical protein [Kitasatospora mediocidica]